MNETFNSVPLRPRRTAQHASLDYPRLAKGGFLLGLALFVLGEGGEFVGHTYFGSIPGWENTLFFVLAVVGVLVALVSPFLFGIVMPLTE